ncbi:MAG: hypothetical protein M1827_002092 [Pycnora praestabilis]|nr:MAG: hypothetical protein M1827_002092 [Pycnora praestabilis]
MTAFGFHNAAEEVEDFAHLSTFDDLERWTPESVDSVQRANIPLMRRSTCGVHQHQNQHPEAENPTAPLMLCHDYKGGYHPYESAQGIDLKQEEYCCEYMQYIDSFIYFSHKLVSIPPPAWTNALHRNGVKTLGTFIIESQTPNVEELLTQDDHGTFPYAKHLACIAECYGFDGWLLNLEKPFSDRRDVPVKVTGFIECLKREMVTKPKDSDNQVVWYDALTVQNHVDYQNGLTKKNLDFVKAADSLFTNYTWTKDHAIKAKQLAKDSGIMLKNVFFGIDVWAQNVNFVWPPRVTYPALGGGGTNTGFAVSELAKLKLSGAMFAPAWTFEHFPKCSRAVESSVWEGSKLPPNLGCDCKLGHPHDTHHYIEHPITMHAREYPSGSSQFFFTDFSRAFRLQKREERHTSSVNIISQLGSQSILPHTIPIPRPEWERMDKGPPSRVIYGELNAKLDQLPRLTFLTKIVGHAKGRSRSDEPKTLIYRLPLFKLSMLADGTLIANITYRRDIRSQTCSVGYYFLYASDADGQHETTYQDIILERGSLNEYDNACVVGQVTTPNFLLIELGLYYKDDNDNPLVESDVLPLLHLTKILIKPHDASYGTYFISNVRLKDLNLDFRNPHRLTWDYTSTPNSSSKSTATPISKTTGPFAEFRISINGLYVGSAHSLEFVLYPRYLRDRADAGGGDVAFGAEVVGVMFDGERVSSGETWIGLEEDWVMIDEKCGIAATEQEQ